MNNLQVIPPQHELPDWMRRAQRGIDWGFLLTLLLSLIVSAPFLLRTELPQNNASENYVYRTADYADSIQEGWLYPRWSPHVLGGYGAPIPNFFAPAAPYAGAILQILLTNSPVSAVRMLYIICLCVGGMSLYALVMRHSGASAGILAAMLYLYSPYTGLMVPHIIGDLPTMLVLALAPALLWGIDRLIRGRQPLNSLYVTLFAAGLMLSSPKESIATLALGIVYGLWVAYQTGNQRRLAQVMAALVLGVTITSFFWMPALLEQSAIHWLSNGSTEVVSLGLSDLIAVPAAFDPADMVHHATYTLGMMAILFGVCGLAVRLYIQRGLPFGRFMFCCGITIAVAALTVLQHEPWLVGLIVLCLACAGSDVVLMQLLLKVRRQRLILPMLLVIIWIGSTNVWFPPKAYAPFGDTGGAKQIDYEEQGYGTAVVPAGEAIPSTLADTLSVSRYLIDSYKTATINKLAPGQISGTFQASPLAHFTHGDRFQIRQVTEPITVNVLTAYFPGWHASIGEQRLSLQANASTGLIQIEVPVVKASTTELSVMLDSTPVRAQSWIIACVSFGLVFIVTIGRIRARSKTYLEDLDLLRQDEARLIALVIVCFGLVALVALMPNPLVSLSPQENSGLRNSFVTQIRSNTGLTLNAFRLEGNIFSRSDEFGITLYWQAQRFLQDNYRVRLYLVNNSDNSVWNTTELRNPGFYPTRRWNTRQYVSDPYRFRLDNAIPEGNYQIHVEAYQCKAGCVSSDRLNFFNPDGQPTGADIILPTLISIHQ